MVYRSFAPSKQASQPSRHPAGSSPTLATAIDAIASDATMTKGMKKLLRCALQVYARQQHLPPSAIPLAAETLRPSLRELTTANTGLSISYLTSIRWALGFALRHLGVGEGMRPHGKIVSPPFAELLALVESRWERIALGSFFAYCTRAGIEPRQVTSDALCGFRHYLAHATLTPNPAVTVSEARLAWNRCVRRHPLWPKAELARASRGDPPTSLSNAFRRDLASYAAYLAGERAHWATGTFLNPPLRNASVITHLALLRGCAAAAVREGIAVSAIGDLADAEVLSAARNGLQKAPPARTEGHIRQQIKATALAAKRWALKPVAVRDPPALAARVPPSSPRKFRQIIDLVETGSLPRLLSLPRGLLESAQEFTDHRRAARAQAALGLEIMLIAPVSSIQVVTIRARDFRCSGAPAEPVPPAMLTVRHLKNPAVSVDYALPDRSVALYKAYRRCLALPADEDPEAWLFPGQNGVHRTADGFGELIGEKIWKHVGLKITPQTLRFLSGSLFLLRHPERYETVRQGMGHRKVAHTRRMFGLVRIANAFRKFDELLGRADGRGRRTERW